MGFMLDTVIPWGRSFAEYVAMFNLSPTDLDGRILGCADGPAAFNHELTRRGGRVVSFDPIYAATAAAIRDRIAATFDDVLDKVRANQGEFVWTQIRSPEELGRVRQAAMDAFLADFEAGKTQGRYVAAAFPNLPFAAGRFDLALCSHLLFLYGPQLSLDFHLQAIQAMLRLAPEARIFPLLELGSQPSRHLDGVMAALNVLGYRTRIDPTAYEFQRGGHQMLRVWRRENSSADGRFAGSAGLTNQPTSLTEI
ncbi:MAG: SAM-dependent methyltransferase [Nodosilinea sp.]